MDGERLPMPPSAMGRNTGYGRIEGSPMDMGLLALAGFKAFFTWTVNGIKIFLSEHNFQVIQAVKLGRNLAPLCDLEGRVKNGERCIG